MTTNLATTPREANTSSLLVLSRRPMVFCSWCSRFVSGGVLPASHTICPTCAALHFPEEASQ